jgi:SAM-dependent methyltransferase
VASNGTAVEPLKQIQKFMWSLGDYGQIARITEVAAGELAEVCGIAAGMEVLDVAAGNGNFAVAAARRGARVVASDLTPQMIELGRTRCEAEGLQVEWVEADAEDLPFEADRFDCCASMFGSMFAPRPPVVTKEMFRVTRPYGLVAMTSWTPQGFLGRLLAAASSYAPPAPEDVPSPLQWGDPAVVRDRLAPHAGSIDISQGAARLAFESPQAGLEFAEAYLGPMVALRTILPPDAYRALANQVVALSEQFNRGPAGSVVIDSDYLSVVARKP